MPAATANEAIVQSLSGSMGLMKRYCEDLTPKEYLHRITPDSNCAAWIIGHLALSDRSALGRLGATDLPALPEGFEKRFSREPEAPKQKEFGDTSVLLPLFEQHRGMLIERVGRLSAEQLAAPLEKPHPRFKTLGELANFMGLHAAVHAGQITMIRRSLGRAILV